MLTRASELMRHSILATDGEIGSVEDLYFDDAHWTVRYLVVDTGDWLPGRQVLISPHAVSGHPTDGRIPVALTKERIEASPSIDTDKPVSRQYEAELARYYQYPPYWLGPHRWGATVLPGDPLAAVPGTTVELVTDEVGGDPHLHSARDVLGYYIEARDGDIGHVEDFLIDEEDRAIRYMVAATRNWWPGKKVLISPEWIVEVSWPASRVRVDLTRDRIREAPEFDPSRPVDREYENRLFGHYGRRQYWRDPV
jgi:hypothetical protein